MKAVILEGKAVNPSDISWNPVTSVIDCKIYENTTEAEKIDHIADAEIVLSNKVIIDKAVFDACPNIKYVGLCSTGYNVVDLDEARARGIVVTNVPAYSTDSVAQLAWSMILNASCKLNLHNQSVHDGDWIKSDSFCYWLDSFIELTGKKIGLIGFGNIGQQMAAIAKAFKMDILVYTSHPDKYRESNPDICFTDLDQLYKESDIISLHCPLTEANQGMINKDSISKMKDGVIIINVSRGPLIVEKDLAEALESGKVAQAACDVVSVEPMQASNPLYRAKNMTITPHIGWASTEARQRLVATVAGNISAFLAGQPQNQVNK